MDKQKIFDLYNNSGIVVQDVYRIQHKPGIHYAGPTVNEHNGLVFTLSGMGRMQFNNVEGIAQNNVVFHGGLNCWHEYATLDDHEWDIIIIAYDILGQHANDIPSGYSLHTYQSPEINKQLIQMHMNQNLDENFHRLRASGMFYNILFELFSNTMNDREMDAHSLYSQIAAYIKDHCTQHLDMLSVARHFGIKENRLYYVFNKFSDVGPAGYLNHCRMNQAVELLKVGGIAVEDVALTVGYSDAFSFSKQFKRKYGIAPSHFQKANDRRNGHAN